MSEPDGALAFAERVLALIDQGRVTATYKYALLLALIDVCMEQTTPEGRAPGAVTTDEVARRILELYWPQTAPYVASGGAVLLRQNAKGQAGIVSAIERFRQHYAPDPSTPLAEARRTMPAAFDRLLATVEWKLIEMPIPRLQFLGVSHEPFIYEIAWDTQVTAAQARQPDFDKHLRFVGNAGDHLAKLAGLLRPLLEAKWIALVTRFNAATIADPGLSRFLFGSQRIPMRRVVGALRDLQDDTCFYCGDRLHSAVEVDHFIPWSRMPDNGIENLVLADPRCNSSKRAFIAAADHLGRWAQRFSDHSALAHALDHAAIDLGWESHPEKTLGVARAIYLRLPAQADLWLRGGEFVKPDTTAINSALSG